MISFKEWEKRKMGERGRQTKGRMMNYERGNLSHLSRKQMKPLTGAESLSFTLL